MRAGKKGFGTGVGAGRVEVLLRDRFTVVVFRWDSGLVVRGGYFELRCLCRGCLGIFVGLGLVVLSRTTSLMLCTLFLQLALGIRILGFEW